MHIVNLRKQFAKFNGQFAWHHYDKEDEMLLVAKCTLHMNFRDREAIVNEGEFIIVPHGVQHMPVADEAMHILLLEPKTTLHTVKERIVGQLERI